MRRRSFVTKRSSQQISATTTATCRPGATETSLSSAQDCVCERKLIFPWFDLILVVWNVQQLRILRWAIRKTEKVAKSPACMKTPLCLPYLYFDMLLHLRGFGLGTTCLRLYACGTAKAARVSVVSPPQRCHDILAIYGASRT